MPAMPDGAKDGILRGLYRYKPAPDGNLTNRVRIMASGTAMLAALEAQQLLAEHHDTAAEVWSATSYKLLRENALAVERWNRLHPTEVPRVPYVSHVLGANGGGPTVAVTDFMKVVPDQVARWVPGPFIPLGTDGYGFSDTRAALRRHFETDAAPHRGGGAVGAGPAGRREGRDGGGGDPPLRHRLATDRPREA